MQTFEISPVFNKEFKSNFKAALDSYKIDYSCGFDFDGIVNNTLKSLKETDEFNRCLTHANEFVNFYFRGYKGV